jgi:hypothetical protein
MSDTNKGTTPQIQINGTTVTLNRGSQLIVTHAVGNGLNAPSIKKDGTPSEMFNMSDASSLFTFAKICPPDYGTDDSVARYTGVPINNPDFIADFHFIGLMRATDKLLIPKNKAVITGNFDTPSATS